MLAQAAVGQKTPVSRALSPAAIATATVLMSLPAAMSESDRK